MKDKDNTNNDEFIAKAAKALGDRSRLLIFREIVDGGSLKITEIVQRTSLAQPLVSINVKQLVNAGLVDSQKRGREVYITVNQAKLEEFLSAIGSIPAIRKNTDPV
jgi:ArsR family transcriptional regulator, arsenate/arsenite/antimonite-responsive transcriptional repressor